ncbi:MAG: HD domain-containing protein [Candidatus Omnitrophica bacterium]|nr:HD domain-containing protein [Candidatus Omnitrophota bacterium]
MKNKKQKIETGDIINFLAEAGQLKRVKRSGWWVVGVKDAESVAEHCFRCAVIGYMLAKMEKADPYKVLFMTLFNDIHEARINDLHKIGHRYIDFKEAEKKVFDEQVKLLPLIIRAEFSALRKEYDAQRTREAVVARDADILECILQAKEYHEFGYEQAGSFMRAGTKFLKTRSARELFKRMKRWDHKKWWIHLTKFER